MKPIKVCEANLPKIQALLDAANGRATEHVISEAWAVPTIIARFESELRDLLPSKALFAGARAAYRSGQALPNAYKFSRLVTYMELERRATGWYITTLEARHEYRQAFKPRLTLTAEQDAAAIAKFKSYSYNVVDNVK
jgi:hypothetical protein